MFEHHSLGQASKTPFLFVLVFYVLPCGLLMDCCGIDAGSTAGRAPMTLDEASPCKRVGHSGVGNEIGPSLHDGSG